MTTRSAGALATRHGATYLGGGRTRFGVFAPEVRSVELVVAEEVLAALAPAGEGYHATVAAAGPGTRYRFLLDGRGPYPDPASRSQPEGVHGPSAVVSLEPPDTPGWRGVPLGSQVICEVHVGTFSAEGTFAGVAASLGELADAGYTAVELMPVGEFPGERNWGYDGVFPFAVQSSYGGAAGLTELVGAAHRAGIAVVVDVVYNHLGPEGAVHGHFAPYFTDRYATPWGEAVNVDGPWSDGVRSYFVEHALYLVRDLGVDGLRLDAVHAIADQTASPFLAELAAAVHAEARRSGRTITVVAESSDNDPRLVAVPEAGGLGVDAVWNDDFHHALRTTLTGESDRWFADFHGTGDLATAFRDGFVLTGRYSPMRRRRHGARPVSPIPGERLVVYAQNHDQVGNAGFGERLAAGLGLAAQYPIAAAVLCSGGVPLRFMGEEYGETAPFHFFTDHGDPALVEAVREGRRAEVGEAGGAPPPDPQDPATFEASRPDRVLARSGEHAELLSWQRALLRLRREEPALGTLEPSRSLVWHDPATRSLALLRRADPYLGGRPVAIILHLAPDVAEIAPDLLAGCTLEVLAVRGVPGVAVGERLGPHGDGSARIVCPGYAALVAGITGCPAAAPDGAGATDRL
ncbi:MAG TPA: malto-oligosyltrehalose trehalohydrolase [Acidimicrobiales bacterium]|nr:malto-oligosyltrehalose trehalohydrolase [Acidimicrobiales bacterium]